MENKLLNCEYSIFGNFSMMYNNPQNLIGLFGEGFTPEITKEITPLGPQDIYTLKSKSGVIKIMQNRIDAYFNEYGTKSLDNYKNILQNLFNNYKNELGISRIAINLSYFNNVNYEELLKKLVSRVDFMSVENPVELNYQINDQCIIDELKFNNIFYVQKGFVQNGKTFEKLESIIFGFDFNSYNCKEYENIFNSTNTSYFFEKLQNRLSEKMNFLFNKIEEGTYEK